MDLDNFDELVFSPEQTAHGRYLKAFALLLLATFVIPIGRTGDTPINVWDRFGVDGTLEVIRLALPALVGLAFGYLGFFARMEIRLKAGISAGLLLLLVGVGVNPFAILEVVVPPITGTRAERMFDMVDGEYFPREDTLHHILLGAGLIALGVGGRYRNLLNSSRIGAYILMGAAALIVAYYTIPYDEELPAARNVELYQDFHSFASDSMAKIEKLERKLADDPYGRELMRDRAFRDRMSDAKMVGQIKLSAVYFGIIYFIPLLLIITSLPAWGRSRYRGHRAVFAKVAGWGASIYLLAFLFPLMIKETARKTGDGFLPALRNYIIFAAVMVGLTLTLSSFLKEQLEPKKDDEDLPADPLAWRQSAG